MKHERGGDPTMLPADLTSALLADHRLAWVSRPGRSITPARNTRPDTLGASLERDRLERRLRRLTLMLAALHGRSDDFGSGRAALQSYRRQTICDLEAQVLTVHSKLRDLVPEQGSTDTANRNE